MEMHKKTVFEQLFAGKLRALSSVTNILLFRENLRELSEQITSKAPLFDGSPADNRLLEITYNETCKRYGGTAEPSFMDKTRNAIRSAASAAKAA